jgi:hypothetical protein
MEIAAGDDVYQDGWTARIMATALNLRGPNLQVTVERSQTLVHRQTHGRRRPEVSSASEINSFGSRSFQFASHSVSLGRIRPATTRRLESCGFGRWGLTGHSPYLSYLRPDPFELYLAGDGGCAPLPASTREQPWINRSRSPDSRHGPTAELGGVLSHTRRDVCVVAFSGTSGGDIGNRVTPNPSLHRTRASGLARPHGLVNSSVSQRMTASGR